MHQSKSLMHWILLGLVFYCLHLKADVVQFPVDAKKLNFTNIYENARLKNPLSLWRRLEVDQKYEDCLKKAPTLYQKNKMIQGWVLVVWGKCLNEYSNKKYDKKFVLNFFDIILRNESVITKGAWQSSMTVQGQKIVEASVSYLENSKNSNSDKKLSEKLKAVLELYDHWLTTNSKKWYYSQMENGLPSLTFSPKVKTATSDQVMSGMEQPTQTIQTIDDLKKWKDDGVVSHIESAMGAIRNSYRKMEYDKIVDIAPIIRDVIQYSNLFSEYLLVLGRSHEMLGNYNKAIEFFNLIKNKNQNSSEFEEALLRSGLCYLRLEKYKEAVSVFEYLVSLDRDKYNVTGRYWWLRSLEYAADPREISEKQKFVSDFSFSYYGLKIRSELDGGKLNAGKPSELPKVKWVLSEKNRLVWNRFKELSKIGWILEAQNEILELKWPQNPLVVFYITEVLSEASLYPSSVKMMAPLLESYKEVRSVDWLKRIYPYRYSQWIEKESLKNKIDAHLIYSLIRQESSFGLKALSSSQAAGLMQMIQPTALDVAEKLKLKIIFPDDLYRPEINIPMGTFYISAVIKEMNQNIPLALAGYNAGPSRVKTFLNFRKETQGLLTADKDPVPRGIEDIWIDELPWLETTGYVKSILRNMLVYELIKKREITYRSDFWRDFILK